MKTVSKSYVFPADPVTVFDHLDDLGITGMHMMKRSVPMMGGKMKVEFLSSNTKGLHTRYRWTGKVLWMPIDFTVVVTEWIRGFRKTWETQGVSHLIIYSWFQMNLEIQSAHHQSIATLSISYEKPLTVFGRVLCFLIGEWYSRWCINNMLQDTASKLNQESPAHHLSH